MIGIILANTGSPAAADPDAIELYLRDYLMDDRIRQLPKPLWKYILHKHILPKRKHTSAKRYRFVWTEQGSPLVVNQERLARNVQRLLDESRPLGGDVLVKSAMSYGEPSIAHVLEDMRDSGVDFVLLLPLYPQSAYSPTLAVVDAFWRAQDRIGWHPSCKVVDNYHDNAAYIDAIAASVAEVGFNAAAGDKLLFSFHAIPLKDEKAGDTYRAQIAESVELVAKRLGIDAADITVGFQSVFGPHPKSWTAPLSRDILAGWRNESFRVVFACPGFSVDCLETLYDIPFEMVPALEGERALPVAEHADGDVQAVCNTSGRFVWVPTLNTTDRHAAVLKDVICSALS